MRLRNTLCLAVTIVLSMPLLPLSRQEVQGQSILPIGAVQGAAVTACRTSRSPFAPASGNGLGTTEVRVQGVIYERTRQRSGASSLFGFFIQNTAATADADPNTSDGIFVFTSTFQTVLRDGGGTYTPQIGDEVILRGFVSEFNFLTEIGNSGLRLVSVVRSGVALDAEIPAFETAPPANFSDADCYWERREGMRARVPAGSIVTGRRWTFASNSDAEVWVIRPDAPVALRSDPYARRVFRDPHPLDNNPALFDDGNGYRILMASLGIKFALGNQSAYIAPARTFDTLTASAVGGIYFSFGKYSVQPNAQITLSPGVNPAANGGVPAFDRSLQYSIATFNVENLYDYRDDPFDGCDFTGNAGCPGVNPPFDYVPANDAAYRQRLSDIADQIITDLRAPDIIMVQEAEDQDICTVAGATLSCGTTNNADGKPDTLQDLALAIAAHGGPHYDAADDRDGTDDRGIISAFLYRTDRVELLPADAGHPVLGTSPTVSYRGTPLSYNTQVSNPKVLNAVLPADVDTSTGVDGSNVFTRAPQIGWFRIWRDQIGFSAFTDVYAIDNHFSSTPNARVGQRTEQAAYNAAIVAALQLADPHARVIVGGDLNVYPRPDDPFAPGSPLYPSDQLGALYGRGLTNLWGRLVADAPANAYSYVFEGQAQTLDQLFLKDPLLSELLGAHVAHINSDWPADFDGDGPRGTSDHDPQAARFKALTLDGLMRLLDYYAATGAIRGQNTAQILSDHLTRAARYKAGGQQAAYLAELLAFANQALGFSPGSITTAAAEALAREARLLRQVGW